MQKIKPYTFKDISLVIPTYNRPEYLERNLANLLKIKNLPYEIIVSDQSKDSLSEKICMKYKKKLKVPLVYLHLDVPSTSRAKNAGIDNSSKKTKIMLFIDDDAYLLPDYLGKILEVYNKYPDAAGVKSFDFYFRERYRKLSAWKKLAFYIEHSIKKLFYLGNLLEKTPVITSPYGNSGPFQINKIMRAVWFPGTDQSFKKEVLKEIRFDDNLVGWALVEDIDITYRITKAGYHLYYTPFAKLVHDHPVKESADEQIRKRAYINQVTHYYFFVKNMPEYKFRYFVNISSIFFLRFLNMFSPRKPKKNILSFYYFLASLAYTFRNRKRIQKGDLRVPGVNC